MRGQFSSHRNNLTKNGFARLKVLSRKGKMKGVGEGALRVLMVSI